ncbi:MAG: hypothetical protein U0694_06230 [Anaerolineae bacterium]
MKPIVLLLILALFVIGIAATALSVQAVCNPTDTGGAGNDTIDCNLANPPATTVSGGDGNDTIIIGSGVFVPGDVVGGNVAGPEAGNDTIVNDGTLSGDIYGDTASGDGSGSDVIINNGFVNDIEGDTQGGNGSGNDIIVNNGTVNYSLDGDTGYGTGSGNDIIVNNGTVGTIFADSADGDSSGNDSVTNNGTVQYDLYGDGSAGNSDGNDVIVNNGYVAGNIYADGDFGTGTGSDIVVNNGTTTNIYGAGGNDTITNNGTVNGDISAGDGDDTVIIQAGAAVVGNSIDGGNNFDTLTFQLNSTDPAELEAAAAAIAAANPAGGTLTIGGVTYTWLNFEQLTQLLNILRINGLADPLALFCAAVDGIDVYAINGNQGYFALYVSQQQISNGVAHAQEIGADVLIGTAALARAYALPTGEVRITHPSGFSFRLAATRCGALPEPQPFTEIVQEVEEDTFVIINRPR